MTHGRKPRQQRWVARDPLALAKNTATRLTPAEMSTMIEPLRAAATALREGVATEWEWAIVVSAVNVAQAIDKLGIVRGLSEHLLCGELALRAIQQRAMATGTWSATSLYYQEIDHLDTAVDLHEFQIHQLSYGEYHNALRQAEAEIRSTGGIVVDVGRERMAA